MSNATLSLLINVIAMPLIVLLLEIFMERNDRPYSSAQLSEDFPEVEIWLCEMLLLIPYALSVMMMKL